MKKHLFHNTTLWFVILILTFCGFAITESPNLHRIRASLIYKNIDFNLVADQNTGVVRDYKPPPEAIRKYALKLLGPLSTSKNSWENGISLARIERGSKEIFGFNPFTSEEKKLFDITNRGKGICSDYIEVYVGLCIVAGIPVREWGITPDQLKGTGGHSFVEIYDNTRDKWVIIDPFLSAWPALKNTPGQSLGLFEYLDAPKEKVIWHPIVNEYYRIDLIKGFYEKRPLSMFIIGDQKLFEPNPMSLPTPILQLLNIILGKSFHFLVPQISNNENFIQGLRNLRIAILASFLVTCLFLLYGIFKAVMKKNRDNQTGRTNSIAVPPLNDGSQSPRS